MQAYESGGMHAGMSGGRQMRHWHEWMGADRQAGKQTGTADRQVDRQKFTLLPVAEDT